MTTVSAVSYRHLDVYKIQGAYGAAPFGLRQSHKNHRETSAMMSLAELEAFDQKVVSVKCGGCLLYTSRCV